MSQRAIVFRIVGAIAVFFVCLAVGVGVAFVLTGLLFEHLGLVPSPLSLQILNALLGFGFLILVITVVARVFGAGHREEPQLLVAIVDAMERIAKGDFRIRVETTVPVGPFADLVNGVNSMAVELDQMEQMRQEFISNVSHEIQSPLTSIRGFAQALQNDQLDALDRRHYLGIIEAESTRLARITENLLRLASLESDQFQPVPKRYRLDRQIRDLILACEPQWMGKGLDMEVTLAQVEVTADEDLMTQVWTNLLNNSIKFTPEGGRVCVELARPASDITVRVTDSGIGISEEDQAHVFERFFKADRARESTKGGSGLGLAIVKRIIGMHQGRIEIESHLGAGTVFTVHLPG